MSETPSPTQTEARMFQYACMNTCVSILYYKYLFFSLVIDDELAEEIKLYSFALER